MSSEYLKMVAAGGEFDLTEAVRQLAKTVTDGPRPEGPPVKSSVTAGGGINGLSFTPGGSGEAVSEPVDYIPALIDGEQMEPPAPSAKKKK